MTTPAEGSSDPRVGLAVLQMATGYRIAQAVYVAAKLGIADFLADGPRDVKDLAEAAGVDARSLCRLLRSLVSVGVFAQVEPDHFALTPEAACLRTGTPDSVRPMVLMFGEAQYRAWADLLFSIQTGQPAFDHQFGRTYWDHLVREPSQGAIYDETMRLGTARSAPAIIRAYDFSSTNTVVDVGGGKGQFLALLLQAHPRMRGVLFDRPHTVAAAGSVLESAGVADRCAVLSGDFLSAVPPGGDTYLIKSTFLSFNDEHALKILQNCRDAVPPSGRLLIIEAVAPSGNETVPSYGSFARFTDLHMLVMEGGRARTKAEHRALLAAAGFELVAVISTQGGQSIIEARPV